MITFTKEGTYTFTITESVPGTATNNKLNGIEYNNNPVTVTVVPVTVTVLPVTVTVLPVMVVPVGTNKMFFQISDRSMILKPK